MVAQRTLGRTLTAGFGAVAAAVLFAGVIGYSSVYRLAEADRKVSQTYQVRRDLSELQARLTDAETGQRGYVITGNERFLAPYITGLELIKTLTPQLRALMADVPEQIRVLDQVDIHIEAKLAELKQTVEMRREKGFDPAAKVVSDGAGKKIMDEIRAMIADMDRQEQALLDSRVAEAKAMSRRAKAVISGGSGCCLCVIALVGWYTTSSLNRQIGSSVEHVQRSLSELQTAANRQAVAVREQVAAVSEVATVTGELAATSRQIASQTKTLIEEVRGTVRTAVVEEIGFSTTRQATEAEQVQDVVARMAHAAKSAEVGSAQLLRTVAELTELVCRHVSVAEPLAQLPKQGATGTAPAPIN